MKNAGLAIDDGIAVCSPRTGKGRRRHLGIEPAHLPRPPGLLVNEFDLAAGYVHLFEHDRAVERAAVLVALLLRAEQVVRHGQEEDALQAAGLEGALQVAVQGVAFEKGDLVDHVLPHGISSSAGRGRDHRYSAASEARWLRSERIRVMWPQASWPLSRSTV